MLLLCKFDNLPPVRRGAAGDEMDIDTSTSEHSTRYQTSTPTPAPPAPHADTHPVNPALCVCTAAQRPADGQPRALPRSVPIQGRYWSPARQSMGEPVRPQKSEHPHVIAGHLHDSVARKVIYMDSYQNQGPTDEGKSLSSLRGYARATGPATRSRSAIHPSTSDLNQPTLRADSLRLAGNSPALSLL